MDEIEALKLQLAFTEATNHQCGVLLEQIAIHIQDLRTFLGTLSVQTETDSPTISNILVESYNIQVQIESIAEELQK